MKAHICIGGPLDGEFATSDDFYGGHEYVPGTRRRDWSKRVEGMYEHLSNDYVQFHNASAGRRRAHVVWIHTSLLPAAKPPRER